MYRLNEDALSLIKELTEENERLYQSYTNLERKCAGLNEALDRGVAWIRAMNTNHIDGMKILKDLRDRIRTNTVSNLKSRMAIQFGTYTGRDAILIKELFDVLDKVCEEILDEDHD